MKRLDSKLIIGDNGTLNEFNISKINFIPKRIFVVSDVPNGETRGCHAHKETNQYLCCISGEINLYLENKDGKRIINLKKSQYVYQPKMTWAKIDFIDNASLMVICSTEYNESDYIRDYNEFLKTTEGK